MVVTGVIFLVACVLVVAYILGHTSYRKFSSMETNDLKYPLVISEALRLLQFFWDQIWFLVTLRPRGLVLPPSLPGRLPILGNAYLFAANSRRMWKVCQILTKHSMEHGGVGLMHLGPHNFFTISDPEDAMTLANSHFDKTYVHDFARPWLRDGLITAKASIWKPHRKLIAPAFNASSMNMFLPVINESARNLVDELSSKVDTGYFDPSGLLTRTILRNSYRTLFNCKDTDTTTFDDYSQGAARILKSFSIRFSNFWLHLDIVYRFSSLKRITDKLIKATVDIVKNIIKNRILWRDANKGNTSHDSDSFRSVLDFMLEVNEKHNVFTDDEIQAHLDTLALAAFDTSSSALLFTFVVIGSYPEVQKKIHQELQEIFEGTTRDVDKYDLSKLVYLEAVLKESLRLHPPVPAVPRTSSVEVKLKNYTLPPNGTYLISLLGINRHPIWGPDAEQFRPERWLEPDSLPANPNIFATFSLGKRNCIAKHYSLMVLKVIFAHVFRKYRVTGDINKVVVEWLVTQHPHSGHEIALEHI